MVKELKGSSSVSVVEEVVGYFLRGKTHARTKIKKISPQASRPYPRRVDVGIGSLLLVIVGRGEACTEAEEAKTARRGERKLRNRDRGVVYPVVQLHTARPLDLNSPVRRPNPLGSGGGNQSLADKPLGSATDDIRFTVLPSSIGFGCCCKTCFQSPLSLRFALRPRTSYSDFLEIEARGLGRAGVPRPAPASVEAGRFPASRAASGPARGYPPAAF